MTLRLGHVVLAWLLLLAAGVVLADPVQQSAYDALCQELAAREHFIWLPPNVSNFFMAKTINLRFAMSMGEEWRVYGAVGPGAIRPVRCGESASADYTVSMSDATALDLATSLTPTATFVDGWRSGRIQIEAHGDANQQRLQDGVAELGRWGDEPVPERIRQYFEGYQT